MKTTKILSFVAGISLLVTSLVPVKVSAASVSLSLSGATNTNGTFSATVYENSDAARVTTAKIDLSFSGAVSAVSYDYSVGQFKNELPSGAHTVNGYVTGSQPVARVTFKVANPGTVTTTAGASYLKGTNDEGTQVVAHSVSGGAATFTYNAPENTGGRGGDEGGVAPTTPGPNTSKPATNKTATNNTTATTDGEVAGDETKAAETAKADDKKKDDTKKSDDKKDDQKKTSSSAWFWPVALVAVIAGYVAARTMRSRAAAKAEADAAAKTASDKPKNKKNKN